MVRPRASLAPPGPASAFHDSTVTRMGDWGGELIEPPPPEVNDPPRPRMGCSGRDEVGCSCDELEADGGVSGVVVGFRFKFWVGVGVLLGATTGSPVATGGGTGSTGVEGVDVQGKEAFGVSVWERLEVEGVDSRG